MQSVFNTFTFTLKKYPVLIPGLISLLLFLYKFQYLEYGPYWDECWAYFPAVKAMAASGPTLIPGHFDPEMYAGHPLLLLFLSSNWVKLLGDSNFVIHLFPILISMGLIFTLFHVSYKWFGFKTAIFSTMLFSIQGMFLAQSSFLLFEVLLSLLILLSYYFFFEKKYFIFIPIATLALWTKESAYTIIPALLIGSGIEFIFFRKDFKVLRTQFLAIFIAAFLGFSFFILQKINVGWFFFPRHLNWVDLSYATIKYKMDFIVDLVFFTQGKKYLTWLGLIACCVFLVRIKNNADKQHLIYFIYLSIFISGFMLFAAINFLSNRYILSAIPFVIILFVYFISSIFNKKIYNTYLLFAVCIAQFSGTLDSKNNPPSDTELSYTDMIKCHTDMIQYLNDSNIKKDSEITTHFLMLCMLKNPACGYLTEPFTGAQNQPTASTKYYIFSTIEYDPIYDEYKKDPSVKLLKRFSQGETWCELYSK
ncbi:MAG TPA: hypothetical protein VK796_02375 [Cytophaga sp.]|nr:hypothetical protein [Cytophaga sp.]